MRTLVDADGLVYLAGFGAEKTRYQLVCSPSPESEAAFDLMVEWFDSVADIKEFLCHTGFVEEERIPHKVIEPLDHALQIAKSKMQWIRENGPKTMEVYIRAIEQANYRDRYATIHGYKANRTAAKPQYFQDIREYLKREWKAIEISHQEVDDEISIRARDLNYEATVASPDKDLDQIPGRHLNYKQNVIYEVDPAEAERWFWIQVLCGDYSDNVRGCWRVGENKACDLVDEWLLSGMDEAEIWTEVVRTYEASMGYPKCPYAGMPPEEVALENARLVYMRKEREEIWTPPGEKRIYELEDVLDG